MKKAAEQKEVDVWRSESPSSLIKKALGKKLHHSSMIRILNYVPAPFYYSAVVKAHSFLCNNQITQMNDCHRWNGCKDAVLVALCAAGKSMLLCWPSAWNEKCLMPLVCLQGLSLFRRWTAMHYWLQNTPAMLFHLWSTADRESGFILEHLGFALH